MGKRLQMREVSSEERQAVKRLAYSRTAPARAVERARTWRRRDVWLRFGRSWPDGRTITSGDELAEDLLKYVLRVRSAIILYSNYGFRPPDDLSGDLEAG